MLPEASRRTCPPSFEIQASSSAALRAGVAERTRNERRDSMGYQASLSAAGSRSGILLPKNIAFRQGALDLLVTFAGHGRVVQVERLQGANARERRRSA